MPWTSLRVGLLPRLLAGGWLVVAWLVGESGFDILSEWHPAQEPLFFQMPLKAIHLFLDPHLKNAGLSTCFGMFWAV